jgi:hypothetical protein
VLGIFNGMGNSHRTPSGDERLLQHSGLQVAESRIQTQPELPLSLERAGKSKSAGL